MSRKEIEILVEKYLNTYSYDLVPGFPQSVEIFINPSKKELRETSDNYAKSTRFIADNKKKVVYVFDGTKALHREMWEGIAKEQGDSRRIYKTEDLLVGVFQNNRDVMFESNYIYPLGIWERIYATDWKWADKYIKGLSSKVASEPTNDM